MQNQRTQASYSKVIAESRGMNEWVAEVRFAGQAMGWEKCFPGLPLF
jgi:hypothetical protein